MTRFLCNQAFYELTLPLDIYTVDILNANWKRSRVMLMREKEFLVNKFYSMYLKRNKTAFNVYRKKKFTFAIAIAIL